MSGICSQMWVSSICSIKESGWRLYPFLFSTEHCLHTLLTSMHLEHDIGDGHTIMNPCIIYTHSNKTALRQTLLDNVSCKEFQNGTTPETISIKKTHIKHPRRGISLKAITPIHYTVQPFMISGFVCSCKSKEATKWSLTVFWDPISHQVFFQISLNTQHSLKHQF